MKPEIHRPTARSAPPAGVFVILLSTIATTKTIEGEDGTVLPLHDVDISNLTHPFFTDDKIVDTAAVPSGSNGAMLDVAPHRDLGVAIVGAVLRAGAGAGAAGG